MLGGCNGNALAPGAVCNAGRVFCALYELPCGIGCAASVCDGVAGAGTKPGTRGGSNPGGGLPVSGSMPCAGRMLGCCMRPCGCMPVSIMPGGGGGMRGGNGMPGGGIIPCCGGMAACSDMPKGSIGSVTSVDGITAMGAGGGFAAAYTPYG